MALIIFCKPLIALLHDDVQHLTSLYLNSIFYDIDLYKSDISQPAAPKLRVEPVLLVFPDDDLMFMCNVSSHV